MLTTFALESIIAYLNDPECNNLVDDEGEWVINEDVSFGYFLIPDDAFNFVDSNSLTRLYQSQKWHACT